MRKYRKILFLSLALTNLVHPVEAKEIRTESVQDISNGIEMIYGSNNWISFKTEILQENMIVNSQCRVNEMDLTLCGIENEIDNGALLNFYSHDKLLLGQEELQIDLVYEYDNHVKHESRFKINKNDIIRPGVPLDAKIEVGNNEYIKLQELAVIDDILYIYGEFRSLPENIDYVLQGQDDQENELELRLRYCDTRCAVFSSSGSNKTNEAMKYVILQLYQKEYSSKQVLDVEEKDGLFFEEAAFADESLNAIGKPLKIKILQEGED